jgi:di/tricarboxylate transporter
MTFDIIIVFIIVAGAIVLFMNEKFPVDLTAILVMAALLITGIITPEEGISGFSNAATVTIAAMFILSTAVFNSGALNFVGDYLTKTFSKSQFWGLLLMMLIVASISGFINDTAVVALFLPIMIDVAKRTGISPSKLLIPLSFGALFGGVNTLIGTSTNILVSSITAAHGNPPIRMFEMTSFGIVILLVGILYMIFIGIKILPDRKPSFGFSNEYDIKDYFTEIIILPTSVFKNKKIKELNEIKDLDMDIIEITRSDGTKLFPIADTVIKENDLLKVKCNIDNLRQIQEIDGLELKSNQRKESEFESSEAKLVEAVITHNSRLRGRTIKKVNFRGTYGANVLALRHRGATWNKNLGNTILLPGDVLLAQVKNDWLPMFRQNQDFVVISEVNLHVAQKRKIITSLFIILSVVVLVVFGIFPIVKTAVVGSVLMILTRCISLEDAYKSINWKVIFLLAGVLALGMALEKTGGALIISKFIIHSVGSLGNTAILSCFFLLTLLFTNFMSNNATAALFVPIAIVTAHSLGVHSRPFIMAITFAASLSFMTPVGYQTNTMVMEPGNYKFVDYFKVGAPLDLIFWIIATLFIPIFFPFK